MEKSRSKIGFNYSVLALLLFILLYIVQFVTTTANANSEFVIIIICVAFLVSFVVAFIGAINTLMGLREKASMEQMVGLIISSIFLLITIAVTIELVRLLNES